MCPNKLQSLRNKQTNKSKTLVSKFSQFELQREAESKAGHICIGAAPTSRRVGLLLVYGFYLLNLDVHPVLLSLCQTFTQ